LASALQYAMVFKYVRERLSGRLVEKPRWNFGYQYCHHQEEMLPAQNDRPHTDFTSLLWTL